MIVYQYVNIVIIARVITAIFNIYYESYSHVFKFSCMKGNRLMFNVIIKKESFCQIALGKSYNIF